MNADDLLEMDDIGAGAALREGEFCLLLDADSAIRHIAGELPHHTGPAQELIDSPLTDIFDPAARATCREAIDIARGGRTTGFSASLAGNTTRYRCLLSILAGQDESRMLCHVSPFSHCVQLDGAPEHERMVNLVRATFRSFPPEQESSVVDRRYLRFFDEIPVIVYAAAPDWRTAVYNRAAEEILRYAREHVMGENRERLHELLYPDPRYRARVVLDREMVATGFLDWPMEPLCGDGIRREILWSNLSGELPVPGLIGWAVGTCRQTPDFETQLSSHRESVEKVRTVLAYNASRIAKRTSLPRKAVVCATHNPPLYRVGRMIEKLGIGLRYAGLAVETVLAAMAVFPADVLIIAPGRSVAAAERIEIIRLASLLPRLPVCILHEGLSLESLVPLVIGGARGVIDIAHAADELVPGLSAVNKGERWYPRTLVDFLFSHGRMMVCQLDGDQGPLSKLTAREKEILTFISLGYGNRDIAQRLCVSPRTVTNHIYHLYGKLEISSRMEALVLAIEAGLTNLAGQKDVVNHRPHYNAK